MMTASHTKAFRNALGQFATGVTVITTMDQHDRKVGMTVNSFSSVSLNPMLVLWSLAKSSKMFNEFHDAKHFAIHVLNADQIAVSNQFSSPCKDRFAGIDTDTGLAGIPILRDYCALFECEMEARHEGGDHIILVGKVLDFNTRNETPLIFHAGRYTDLEQSIAL